MSSNQGLQMKIADLIMQDTLTGFKETVDTKLDELKSNIEEKLERIQNLSKDGIEKLEATLEGKPLIINLGTITKPKGVIVHKAFNTVTKILESAKRKEKNIMLVGGAGGGKTHLASSIASAMKLDFYPMSVGLQTTKSDLLGFINAQGVYMPSVIRKAYEDGGLLLLDEFDAAHAGVITILNSLLANGHCSFPDKIVTKHPNFVCICACNTYGKGGTMDYVGRNRLDAATLDRFIIVDVDYDKKLEKKLTDNEAWYNIVEQARKAINKYGIRMIVSPRASMDGADLLEAGFKVKDVLEMTIYKGCDKDIKTKISKELDLSILDPNSEPKSSDDYIWEKSDYNDWISINYDANYKDVHITRGIRTSYRNFTINASETAKEWAEYIDDNSLWVNTGTGIVSCYDKKEDVKYNRLANIAELYESFSQMIENNEIPEELSNTIIEIVYDRKIFILDFKNQVYCIRGVE